MYIHTIHIGPGLCKVYDSFGILGGSLSAGGHFQGCFFVVGPWILKTRLRGFRALGVWRIPVFEDLGLKHPRIQGFGPGAHQASRILA